MKYNFLAKLGMTPDPWEKYGDVNVSGKSGSRFVCSCGYNGMPSDVAENKNNARLIAAAPKMLKLLIYLFPKIENTEFLNSPISFYDIDLIENTIKEITGKTIEELRAIGICE